MYRGVPPQSGLVSKRPPARVTHEWLLPCVDAMVTLESVELGKLLTTLVTAVRTFPCMDFNMLVERIPLGKSPETNFTFKGFGSSMDSIVMF